MTGHCWLPVVHPSTIFQRLDSSCCWSLRQHSGADLPLVVSGYQKAGVLRCAFMSAGIRQDWSGAGVGRDWVLHHVYSGLSMGHLALVISAGIYRWPCLLGVDVDLAPVVCHVCLVGSNTCNTCNTCFSLATTPVVELHVKHILPLYQTMCRLCKCQLLTRQLFARVSKTDDWSIGVQV